MSLSCRFVTFRLDDRQYALPLPVVERAIRAVEVTPLPNAPPVVLGVINVHGQVIPVLNVRRRFQLPERAIEPSDWFLLARTARRRAVLVVDASDGVLERASHDVVRSAGILPGLEQFPGVITLDEGLVLIHDLERFLSLDETRALDQALDDSSRASDGR